MGKTNTQARIKRREQDRLTRFKVHPPVARLDVRFHGRQILNEILPAHTPRLTRKNCVASGERDGSVAFHRSYVSTSAEEYLYRKRPASHTLLKKGSSASRPNSLSYNEVDAALSVIAIFAVVAAAHLGQDVIRRGQRAVITMTKGILEAVGLGGHASG